MQHELTLCLPCHSQTCTFPQFPILVVVIITHSFQQARHLKGTLDFLPSARCTPEFCWFDFLILLHSCDFLHSQCHYLSLGLHCIFPGSLWKPPIWSYYLHSLQSFILFPKLLPKSDLTKWKSNHFTPLLKIQWPPVAKRIKFQLLSMTYKVLHDLTLTTRVIQNRQFCKYSFTTCNALVHIIELHRHHTVLRGLFIWFPHFGTKYLLLWNISSP